MNPYTDQVLHHFDPDVRATLTSAQIEALDRALSSSNQQSRHWMHVQAILPLYFLRLYFVFLIGRDQRTQQLAVEDYRRHKADNLANLILLFFVVLPAFSLVLFSVLYLVKSIIGIDIFPNFHLLHFFGLHRG